MSSLERLRRDPRIARLESALAAHSPIEADDSAARRAAVAILIRLGESDEPEIFFIQRAIYEGDPWSGQIAFPGGREEQADDSMLETAVRETFEETELDLRQGAHLVGTLNDLRPRTVRLPAVMVRPFIFLVDEVADPVLSPEVAGSFWVPLSVLLDRSVWRDTTVHSGGNEMSRFAFHHQGYVVWGMTERILSGLLSLLG
ncbi:MAG: CoA pyrophosphatase [Gemmatimonadales bacterium]